MKVGLTGLSLVTAATLAAWIPGSAPWVPRDRTTMIIGINDVYRIEGLERGSKGGLARVRALRAEIERDFPEALLLHGGDFLFPSFASRMYRGEQMISVLNLLDGDQDAFDGRMFVTPGNHEFDRGRLEDAPMLRDRIDGSQFRWLAGNLSFARGPEGEPLVASKNLSRTALVESGGIKIGIFGLTLPTLGVRYIEGFEGERETARLLTAELRARGAEVVVGLTHLEARGDRAILEQVGALGPDIIFGGHDHEAMHLRVDGRFYLKADADARTASVVRVTKKADGALIVEPRLVPLSGSSPVPDAKTQARVDDWQDRHARTFCAAAGSRPQCLEEPYGRTRTILEADEYKIRSRETALGNWIADRMLEAFRPCGAQVAFVNSGALRLNQDVSAGAVLTRRHIEELFAYPSPMHLLKIDGATLGRVAEQSMRAWPGAGSFLQIAGFGFRHDRPGRTATEVSWLDGRGPRRVGAGEPVLAVTVDYLLNPDAGDQDGYQMLNRGQVQSDCAVGGLDIKELVIRELKRAEPPGIAPVIDGRICQGEPGVPCRLPSAAKPAV
jgi:5'-nucleotidase / UDP-sugar diphosphatase